MEFRILQKLCFKHKNQIDRDFTTNLLKSKKPLHVYKYNIRYLSCLAEIIILFYIQKFNNLVSLCILISFKYYLLESYKTLIKAKDNI